MTPSSRATSIPSINAPTETSRNGDSSSLPFSTPAIEATGLIARFRRSFLHTAIEPSTTTRGTSSARSKMSHIASSRPVIEASGLTGPITTSPVPASRISPGLRHVTPWVTQPASTFSLPTILTARSRWPIPFWTRRILPFSPKCWEAIPVNSVTSWFFPQTITKSSVVDESRYWNLCGGTTSRISGCSS